MSDSPLGRRIRTKDERRQQIPPPGYANPLGHAERDATAGDSEAETEAAIAKLEAIAARLEADPHDAGLQRAAAIAHQVSMRLWQGELGRWEQTWRRRRKHPNSGLVERGRRLQRLRRRILAAQARWGHAYDSTRVTFVDGPEPEGCIEVEVKPDL